MQLTSGVEIPDGLLAANALLAENSRQGFGAGTHTLYQGFGVVISHTSLGISGSLYDGRTGSRYTGKERDAESGLDYFGARYYGSSMGRFMSPDPVFASAARVMDPQQWNMYAYARNNPLSITDPTGLDFNLSCSGGDTLTCQNGVQGQTLLADGGGTRFEATDVDMNKQGDPSAGYSDQFGNNYKGTFDQNNGVSFTDSANGQISSHSQFIDGSDATQLGGSGAFAGIQGNFFDACGSGSSCQGRATLSGASSAFSNMENTLSKSSRFSTLLDGLSLAHPFITDQYRGGDGGYAHVIKAPGYMWDMHFEGNSPGAGVTGFALHMLGTIKEISNGTAVGGTVKDGVTAMTMKWITTAIVLSFSLCWGQARYTIPLVKAQPELAVPTIVTRNGVVYAAYRSFDLLHRSEQLQVASYDLVSHKELRHATVSVPKVRGTRASEKLALSRDGTTLAYVETGAPSLVLLIAAKDLSEVRRLEALPYQEKPDRYEAGPSHFYGFDAENNLCFQSSASTVPRFVRVSSSDFKIVTDTSASLLGKKIWTIMNWDTKIKRFWLENDEKQYQEDGKPSGEELSTLIPELNKGAYSLANDGFLGFYAMVSKGAVVRYEDHRNQTLELPCSPSPYGISSNGEYAGAVCITQPGGLPEAGGDRVLTSEFLLIKSSGPTVVWREKLARLGAGDQGYYRWASSSIEADGEKTWVVIPMKSPELAVSEIVLPR